MERASATEEERWRYLEFVQQAAAQTLVVADAAYAYAKQGVGPLRPGLGHRQGRRWLYRPLPRRPARRPQAHRPQGKKDLYFDFVLFGCWNCATD